MPEDLPKAVAVLLWLLIGLIVFGYLVLESTMVMSVGFAVIFYGIPAAWMLYNSKETHQGG